MDYKAALKRNRKYLWIFWVLSIVVLVTTPLMLWRLYFIPAVVNGIPLHVRVFMTVMVMPVFLFPFMLRNIHVMNRRLAQRAAEQDAKNSDAVRGPEPNLQNPEAPKPESVFDEIHNRERCKWCGKKPPVTKEEVDRMRDEVLKMKF